MKRSENVSWVVMGAVAFAATFGGGMAYFAMQKPNHAAQAQTAVADQQCTTRSDDTRDCTPQRRSFAYYLVPRWSWGWGTSSEPIRRDVALSGSRTAYAPAPAGGIERSGFGSTARSPSIRVSAGG